MGLESCVVKIRHNLAYGAAWIGASGVVTNLLTFITTLVLAHALLPSDFGLVAVATTVTTILTSVTDLSLSSALIQHHQPTPYHFHTAWTLNALRGAIIGGLCAIGAFPLAHFYNDARLTLVIGSLALGIFISSMSNPRAVVLTKELIFWQQFMLAVGQRLATLIVSVAIALLTHSYWALVFGNIAGQFAMVLISYIVVRYVPRLSLRHVGELINFSGWLSAGQVINTINWNFDQLVIGRVLGRAPLGFYTVGNNIAVMPTREATAPITTTLFPAFSRLIGDKGRLAAAYQSAQALTTSIALPAGIGLALIARPMVSLFMGERWLPAVFLIQALASVFAIQTLGTLSQPLAMAAGETKLLFKRDFQSFLLRIPFLIVGLITDGLRGVIIARICTGIIVIIFHMQVVRKITDLSLWSQLRVNVRSICSATAMVVAVLAASPLLKGYGDGRMGQFIELALTMLLGGCTYVAVHFAIWTGRGYPDGPERELVNVLKLMRRKISPL